MKYKELFKWIWPKEDDSYQRAIQKRKVWENFNSITKKQVMDVILKFLNAWKCRIPYKRAPELLKACKETSKYFDKLKSKNILTINLKKHALDIENIFNILSSVGNIKGTAISKIMHMSNPELFPMFDNEISFAYGVFQNAEGYLRFMRDMQQKAFELAKNYCKETHSKKLSAEIKIGERKATLTKFLDEYNYEKYTRKNK